MTLNEAREECRRYLDYVANQEHKATAMLELAADRRVGRCDEKEAKRRLDQIHGPGVTVYDGAKLREAIAILLEATE